MTQKPEEIPFKLLEAMDDFALYTLLKKLNRTRKRDIQFGFNTMIVIVKRKYARDIVIAEIERRIKLRRPRDEEEPCLMGKQ